MVPTEIFATKVTGHIHRDMAGLFTPSATALRQTARRTTIDLDLERGQSIRRVLARMQSNWRRLTP